MVNKALIIIGAFLSILSFGYFKGRASEKAKQNRKTLENVAQSIHISKEVDSLTLDSAAKQLQPFEK